MRKLLLFFFALLAGVSGVWADETWSYNSGASGANFTVWALGLQLPSSCSSDYSYKLKDGFTITYRGDSGTKALYMAICKDSGINTGNSDDGVTYPASKVLAVSSNASTDNASSCTYTFSEDVVLIPGTTYYAMFFTSNVATNGNYTRKKQGIKVVSGSYPPTYINTYNTGALTDYQPIFSTTLTEGETVASISALVSTLYSKMEARNLSGVGYPKSSAVERTDFNTALTEIQNYTGSTTDAEKASNYPYQLKAYNNYLACTDVDLPEEGRTYTIQNFQPNGATYYLYRNGNEVDKTNVFDNENAIKFYFVAHKLTGDKYIFKAKGTDNLHFVIAANNDKTMTDGYTVTDGGMDLSAMKIVKFSPTMSNPKGASGLTTGQLGSVTDEDCFGGLCFWGSRSGVTGYPGECVIIMSQTDGGFDSWRTTQIFGTPNAGNSTYYSSAFYITEVDGQATESYYNTVTLNSIGGHSYATTYLPFAVKMPEGVKAYKATGDGDSKLTLVKVADGDAATDAEKVLPALTAAVLYKDAGTATETKTLEIVESDASAPDDNILDGSLKAADSAPSGACVLWGSGSEVGFYPLSDSTLPTCKAYYAPASPVKGFTLSFEEVADGIRAAQGEEMQQQGIYNLSGQRIQKPTQGLYIVNGKKVVIK